MLYVLFIMRAEQSWPWLHSAPPLHKDSDREPTASRAGRAMRVHCGVRVWLDAGISYGRMMGMAGR